MPNRRTVIQVRWAVIEGRESVSDPRGAVIGTRCSVMHLICSVIGDGRAVIPARWAVIQARGSVIQNRCAVIEGGCAVIPAGGSVIGNRSSDTESRKDGVAYRLRHAIDGDRRNQRCPRTPRKGRTVFQPLISAHDRLSSPQRSRRDRTCTRNTRRTRKHRIEGKANGGGTEGCPRNTRKTRKCRTTEKTGGGGATKHTKDTKNGTRRIWAHGTHGSVELRRKKRGALIFAYLSEGDG